MSYPVGTICIGQNFVISPEMNGMECRIAKPVQMRWIRNLVTNEREYCPVYVTVWANGEHLGIKPHNLKRKDWHDEEKRAEDRAALNKRARKQLSEVISACKKAAESAIEAGEKVDQEEGAE